VVISLTQEAVDITLVVGTELVESVEKDDVVVTLVRDTELGRVCRRRRCACDAGRGHGT
jgi:hypothetical protein